MHSPPSLKYSKQPRCRIARFSSVRTQWPPFSILYLFSHKQPRCTLPSSAANSLYNAIANTLIAVQYFFRFQWKEFICCKIRSVSVNEGIFSGDSSSFSRTTSFKATVMPPAQKQTHARFQCTVPFDNRQIIHTTSKWVSHIHRITKNNQAI